MALPIICPMSMVTTMVEEAGIMANASRDPGEEQAVVIKISSASKVLLAVFAFEGSLVIIVVMVEESWIMSIRGRAHEGL